MKREGGVLTVCWCTYVIIYLCRVNFSSAMEKLMGELEISPEALGMAGGSFFFFYAVGQLVNGFAGDCLPPHKMVMTALLATGIMNILVALSGSFPAIWLWWSLNGFFQSMIWGPLMRILAQNYPQEDNANVSMKMSASMVAGFALSWVVFGRLFLGCSRMMYFLVPSVLSLGTFLFWKMRFCRKIKGSTHMGRGAYGRGNFKQVFLKGHLWMIAIVCFGMGMVKETLSLWGPLLMTRMLHMEVRNSLRYILVVPMANFAGILFSRFAIGKTKSPWKTLIILFGIAGVSSLTLLFGYRGMGKYAVFLMALVSGMMYGSNAILLSYIPISFQKYHIVSSLVGSFDFMSYMGAAVSSAVLGMGISGGKYGQIFLAWLIISGTVIVLVAKFVSARHPQT